MSETIDESFYDRADEHINLSNEQLKQVGDFGKVNASMMFGTTRFNAWVSARNFTSGEEMAGAREAMLKYFCDQYRLMLEDNLDDHIRNFELYSGAKSG